MGGKWLVGGVAALSFLVAVSLVITLTDVEENLESNSPERTVQLYLRALKETDFKTAYGLLSNEVKLNCTVGLMASSNSHMTRELSESNVTLVGTTLINDTAIVTVRVTSLRNEGIFGTADDSHEQRFALVKQDGRWQLSNDPWINTRCGNTNTYPQGKHSGTSEQTPSPQSQSYDYNPVKRISQWNLHL